MTTTSSWSYRSQTDSAPASTRLYPHSTSDIGSGGIYRDAMLEKQLEQARLQRTGFYRRLADTGRRDRGGDSSSIDPSSSAVASSSTTSGNFSSRRSELSSNIGRRRLRHSDGSAEPTEEQLVSVVEVSKGQHDPLVFSDLTESEIPKPQTSWRFYTSYDNELGEWRRHAVPLFKTEDEDKKLSKSETSIDDRLSAYDRHSRPRGCAALLQTPTRLSGIDDRPRAGSEEISTSVHYNVRGGSDSFLTEPVDVGSGSYYGEYRSVRPYVDDLMRKILGNSWRRSSDETTTERIIIPNKSRTSILDDGVAAAPNVEIPEGNDESAFKEKTLAPSGRPWVSVPSLSERILMMSTTAEGEEVIDVVDNTDEDNVMTETKRSAVMDWLQGSSEGGSGNEIAAVLPFGIGSAANSTKVHRMAPVHSETTVREETRTTVETVGGQNRTQLSQSSPAVDIAVDQSSIEGTYKERESANKTSSSVGNRIQDRGDVVWIPVIHVPGPTDVADAGNRDQSTIERIMSATSWSKQPPDASSLHSHRTIDVKELPVTSTAGQSCSPILRPTAVMASSSGPSPTIPTVVQREPGTYSSSISLHTGDKPTTGRAFSSVPFTSDAGTEVFGSGSTTTCAAGLPSVGGSETGGFRSSVAGSSKDASLIGAKNGSNVGVYRSETCFSVDAVHNSDRRREAAVTPLSDNSSRTAWRTPGTTATETTQPISTKSSADISTTWNTNYAVGFRPSVGVTVERSSQQDTTAADVDDGDWVIEKAV